MFGGTSDPRTARQAAYAETVKRSTISTVYTTLGVLVVIAGLLLFYRFYYQKHHSGENFTVNVGSQGTFRDVQTSPSKKMLQCYLDEDCPDETVCSEKGICVPRIHELPRDYHMMKDGRGRGEEKPTTNQ